MLFGKVIFIKKTGGEGSRFPVTEKKIPIGRSEGCLIRIQNPEVALQHCELIVEDSGEVKLKTFSNNTFLNDELLNVGEYKLHHADIFKIGSRMARWEYPPSSKFYQPGLPSPRRLVAIVKPQRRSFDVSMHGQTSTPQVSLSKTSLGLKRRYSERPISETGSSNKVAKAHSSSKIHNNINSVSTVTLSQDIQSAKMLFAPKIRGRKSTSEIRAASLTSPKTRTFEQQPRKSVSPSWKVQIRTPPNNTKSIKRKSTPIKKNLSIGKLNKSSRQSGLLKTTTLNVIVEDSPKETYSQKRQSTKGTKTQLPEKSTNNSYESPQKKIFERKKLAASEKKLKVLRTSLSAKSPKVGRFSLSAKAVGITSKINLLKSCSRKSMSSVKSSEGKSASKKLIFDNINTKSTPQKENETIKRSPISSNISPEITPPLKKLNSSNDLIMFNTPKSMLDQRTATPAKAASNKKSPGRPRGGVSKASAKSLSTPAKLSSPRGRLIYSSRKVSLNSSDRLAKKAATKLKNRNPRKPDKNKKAALLVLGKAIRQQSTTHSVKTLLKKKKKAIKQSTQTLIPKNLSTAKLTKKKKRQNSKMGGKKSEMEEVKLEPEVFDVVSKKSDEDSKSNTSAPTPKKLKKSPEKKLSIQTQNNSIPSDKYLLSKISCGNFCNSNRRSSKRLSSKNDVDKPEYMELSPTALGLIPKNNDDIFKTPKEKKKRRSISLTTPKNSSTIGIIKSASTNKKMSRKSVRFSSSNTSMLNDCTNSFMDHATPFKFESVETPNISLDVFVSPLFEMSWQGSAGTGSVKKSTSTKKNKTPAGTESLCAIELNNSEHKKTKCARRLLQSPDSKPSVDTGTPAKKRVAEQQSSTSVSKRVKTSCRVEVNEEDGMTPVLATPIKSSPKLKVTKMVESPGTRKINGPTATVENSRSQLSPKNDLSNVGGVKKLFATPKPQKSPKNDLTQIRGLKKLLATPKVQKSPKNDLSNIRGVKKLLTTPKVQKSPKNDLSDVKGVKKLFSVPKVQKSPKNDLSDLRGVKKLLASPRIQRSPRNSLSDLRGVKKLLGTPKVQKSPKNDLSNIRGVKKLLTTPKVQKSPKNDLSDVKGVKKLFSVPKVQKSPKNDLSDLRGVKKLLASPRIQRSPRNSLSDLRGVKKLLGTPKVQKSPKNDLSDLRGVKRLLSSPRNQKGPKNELTDLKGVKKLLSSPKVQKSPKNDLTDVEGIGELFKSIENSPVSKRISRASLSGKESPRDSSSKSPIKNLNTVKGLDNTSSKSKSPKNSLTDLEGVPELFSRQKPINDLNVSFTGVSELFDSPRKEDAVKSPRKSRPMRAKTLTRGRKSENVEGSNKETVSTPKTVPRRGRSRTVVAVEEPQKKIAKTYNKDNHDVEVKETAGRMTRRTKKEDVEASPAVQKQTTRGRKRIVSENEDASINIGKKRMRSKAENQVETSTPRPRRKQVDDDDNKVAATRKTRSKKPKTDSKNENAKGETKTTVRRKKAVENADEKPQKPRTTSRVQTKSAQASPEAKSKERLIKSRKKVAEDKAVRSTKVSPRKTRSAAKN